MVAVLPPLDAVPHLPAAMAAGRDSARARARAPGLGARGGVGARPFRSTLGPAAGRGAGMRAGARARARVRVQGGGAC